MSDQTDITIHGISMKYNCLRQNDSQASFLEAESKVLYQITFVVRWPMRSSKSKFMDKRTKNRAVIKLMTEEHFER